MPTFDRWHCSALAVLLKTGKSDTSETSDWLGTCVKGREDSLRKPGGCSVTDAEHAMPGGLKVDA